MKAKHIQYGSVLFIPLLSATTLFSCVNTKQTLSMNIDNSSSSQVEQDPHRDSSQSNTTQQLGMYNSSSQQEEQTDNRDSLQIVNRFGQVGTVFRSMILPLARIELESWLWIAEWATISGVACYGIGYAIGHTNHCRLRSFLPYPESEL